MRFSKRKSPEANPWGRVAGLLSGFAMTLIGVVNQLDPHIILLRAFAGAVIVGLIVFVSAAIVRASHYSENLRRE